MLKQFSKSLRALLIAVLAVGLCLAALAQNQSQPPAQSSTPAKKGGAGIACDGALDIVPTKSMTFVRKRRPARADGKQPATPADSQTQPKPPGGSQSSR